MNHRNDKVIEKFYLHTWKSRPPLGVGYTCEVTELRRTEREDKDKREAVEVQHMVAGKQVEVPRTENQNKCAGNDHVRRFRRQG